MTEINYLQQNIKFLREYNMLSQKELGNLLGVSEDIIGTYEKRGTRPKDHVIHDLVLIFGIEYAHLATAKINNENYFILYKPELQLPKHRKRYLPKKKIEDEHSEDVSLLQERIESYNKKPFELKIILNLTESNRVLSESNKTLAEANKQLADNTTMLSKAVIGDADLETSVNVQATLQALQEYLAEVSAQVNNTTVQKTAAELGIRMVQKKKALGKKGNRADADK